MMLEFAAVGKKYHGESGFVRALDGVTLTAAQGEFIAVQGPSGCGKTTLLLIAGGLLAPDEGSVLVEGRNPYTLSPDERAHFRASRIGFVFQQFHLVPYLSVYENILAPSIAHPLPDAEKRTRELMEQFHLTGRERHLPSALSTGERQRVALARAFLNRPGLILADEPTGNLDKENAAGVLSSLAAYAGEGGAVLMVTHSDTAAGYAHRTIGMRNGIIV